MVGGAVWLRIGRFSSSGIRSFSGGTDFGTGVESSLSIVSESVFSAFLINVINLNRVLPLS